ncbi:MAG: BTAD domain-containing putative transcriptional regulator [Rhodospirillales bacterium]|nr:BTAD domain-containing putative transcriptional regulator [Rhodospirillales bacterium]
MRLPTKKSLALLVYLACPPGVARSRDRLAGMLWSHNTQDQARTSLRQNLARLRKSLGPDKEVISADARSIELVAECVETDVAKFEGLVSLGDVSSLESAADLLRGEFASGLSINEGPFEDWLTNERSRLSELAVSALGRLLGHYDDRQDFEEAAVIARQLLTLDPLQERVHQSLMRALANRDRFESALQQYKLCRDLLRRELGIEPSEQTRVLREEIARRRQAVRHAPNAPAVETDGLVRTLGAKSAKEITVGTNLPPQLQGLDLSPPKRPSILILPFENLTGDGDNDHLAEGLRIDIQAAMVKITGVFIIAAGSANAMRGRDAKSAADAFGVRHVLQGSVRKSGSRLRVSAELIDVQLQNAIWTETYDRLFDDGFAVQDEIIEEIVTALDVKLLRGEQAAVWHKTLKDREALVQFYKGIQEFFKLRKDANLRARKLFEAVEKRQPEVSTGATWTALCHWFDAFKAWDDPAVSLDLAGEWAEKAVRFDDADGQAHMVLSHVHLINRRFDDALIVGREAISLRPNCTNANGFFANVLHYCGEHGDAIEHVTWAIRYSPVYPPFFADVLALALLFDGSVEAALAVAGESLRVNPDGVTARLVQIATYSQLGEIAQAREIGESVLAADAAFSLQRFAAPQPYRKPSDLESFVSQLSAAGLPV